MRVRSMPYVLGAAAALVLSAAPARAQVKAGPEFQANTYTTESQDRTSIAVEKDGDFIVVWRSFAQEALGSSFGVFGQRYDRSGVRRGAEFQANTYTTGSQSIPEIAVNQAGNFAVVWNSALQDGSSTGVFGQRYDASGNRAGGEFRVNSYTTGYQGYTHVTMDAKGNFMVVWESALQDGLGDGVFSQRYDASGTARGAEFRVNTYTTGSQESAKLAMRASGEAVVVWESPQDGLLDGVYAQRFDANGAPVGAEFRVNTYTTNGQDEPAVGMAADGRFVVVWESDFAGPAYQEIRGQRFNADGTPAGGEFAVNTYTTDNQFIYSVAVDHQGNFVVTWDDYARDGSSYGLFGQRFTAAGTFRGAEFLVNTYTTGYQAISANQSDEVGNFMVSWQDHTGRDGNLRGIFAQRWGGLFPTALNVDAAGNRVWEPGETAGVVPTWRNLNGASQTFGGTLSAITGPAGATYTIPDGTADYGAVPNGTSAPCTDCYTVAVNNPPARPVQHWDASALESVTPDTQGQQKRWTLHIGGSFTDVSTTTNPFYRFIETLLHYSITGGCGGTNYCPTTTSTRDQMSVFVLIAKEGAGYLPPACTTPVFPDVPASNPFCRFIEELSRRGVVSGCGGGNYCPTSPVTREQMPIFVLRTLDPTLNPPACAPPNLFNDVPETNPFCRWIEELANRGVVGGCGGGNYCPTQSVTREQMGVFITATFGLTLYGL